MKPTRRSFLRLLGIGAGAAVAAPVLARLPEPEVPIEGLEKLYHANVEKDLLDRLRSGQLSTVDEACAGTGNERFLTPRDVKAMLQNPYWTSKQHVGLGPVR
ncbi:hypothetical protein D3C76_26180 [compost metagenome]